jgi:hypothetical protein
VVVRALTLIVIRAGSLHNLKILLRVNIGKLLIGVFKVNSGRHCACARGDEAHEMS